ncbi:MAG: hypothetical protein MJE12_00535 [Alphaproteobacteria bacterium]|nr:hypothetical protein [Alphaproteobacteria bacterium]
MLSDVLATLCRRAAYVLAAALICAFLFTWVQVLTGTNDIAKFIGEKIAQRGAYPERFAIPIGWTVHMIIALAYAVAYTAFQALPFMPKVQPARLIAGLVAVVVFGFVTTWIANPAISITISVLAGQGWPEKVASIYFKLGVPLWNHLLFFFVTFLIVGVLADALSRPADTSGGK